MNIRIRRIDKSLPLPEYKTPGAVAFDLYSRESMSIPKGKLVYAPLNVVIETPEGHMTLLAARSSLHKRGLITLNGVGIFDQDFRGNGDEFRAILYNFSDEDVTIERGERIVQATIVPIQKVVFTEVDDMQSDERGGIGSTGIK